MGVKMPLQENTLLRDYRIIRFISQDTTGEFYLAQDTALGRKVLIQKLDKVYAGDPVFIDALYDTARKQANLMHQNLVNLHSLFSEGSEYYLVLDSVEGNDLQQYIRESTPLEHEKVTEWMIAVLDALAEAHKLGVMHGHIALTQLFIDTSGKIKLAGLGITALFQKRMPSNLNEREKLYYQSPEQIIGMKDIDSRSDIYSLGVVYYQLLTGKLPYSHLNDSEFLLMKEITETPCPDPRDSNSSIPSSVAEVVKKMLEKDRSIRYSRAEEALQRLRSQNSLEEFSKLSAEAPASLFKKAVDLFQSHDFDQAKMLFKIVIEKEPENAMALYYYGLIEMERGNFAGANQYLTKALVLQPWNDKYLYHIGLLNYRQGKFLAAEEYFQKALKVNSDYAQAYYDGNPYQVKQTASMSNQRFETSEPEKKKYWPWFVVIGLIILVSFGIIKHRMDQSLPMNDMLSESPIPQDDLEQLNNESMNSGDTDLTPEDAITYVQQNYLDNYPQRPIKEAIDLVFINNPTWSGEKLGDSNRYVVKVSGMFMQDGRNVSLEITYQLSYSSSERVIVIQGITINNEIQGSDVINQLLNQMYPTSNTQPEPSNPAGATQ